MGPGGVGKSCLVLRVIMNEFVGDYDPTIEDNYRKQIVVDHKPLVLDIMDTAGQEEFNMLEDQWIRIGEGFLLVFDVMDASTVDEAVKKYQKIIRQKEMDNVPVVLVGNKMDMLIEQNLKSSPATEQAKAFAQKWGCHYMEASAKSSMNVTQCFEEGVRAVRKWRIGSEPAPVSDTNWCSIL
jgi:GTPase KRas protein